MKWNLKGIFFRLIPNINEHEASQNFTLHPPGKDGGDPTILPTDPDVSD
jgi:hypothetical protein